MAMTLPLRRPWSINFYTLQLRTPAQSRRSRQGVTGPSSQYQEITMAKGQGRCHCHLDSNPHDKSISFRGEKAMPFFFFFFIPPRESQCFWHFSRLAASFFFHALLPNFRSLFLLFFFFFCWLLCLSFAAASSSPLFTPERHEFVHPLFLS